MSHRRGRLFRTAVFCLLLAFIAIALLGVRSLLVVAAADLRAGGGSAVFLDRNGLPIISDTRDRPIFVSLENVAPHLRQAVVAMEDARFYEHHGVDPISVLRAAVSNLRGGALQGASTITQQLVKNAFLTPERTFRRKIEEAALAMALEARLTKDEILELYLNRIYLGEGAYGVQAAARTYFGKNAADLSLAESAVLAALLPAPSLYSPTRNMELAVERRNLVLSRMAELDLIDADTAAAAAQEELILAPRDRRKASYFTDFVTDQLVASLGPELTFHGDLRVETTLDLEVQERAAQALGERQGAIIVLDLENGDILAMVGGRDYRESQFNRATHALRQPGSAFKPFVYAAALERGWTLSSLLQDQPRSFAGYEPANWNQRYWGEVTMKQAMAQSLNVASVWLLHQIGPRAALDMARRLGIDTLTSDDRHLALALGGLRRGVSPLALAQAYTAFAKGGVMQSVRSIRRVTDRAGREWPVTEAPSMPARVLSPEIAYLITDMLQYALQHGTGTAARIGYPAAGKTGSTNDTRDAWFVGYTPRYLAAVYVGHDDNRPLGAGGGALAAPIWRAVMADLAGTAPTSQFPVPSSIVTGVPIDITTGLRANADCPQQHPTSFIRGTEPHAWAPCAIPDEPDGSSPRETETGDGDISNEEAAEEEWGRPDDPDPPDDGTEHLPRGLLFLRQLFTSSEEGGGTDEGDSPLTNVDEDTQQRDEIPAD